MIRRGLFFSLEHSKPYLVRRWLYNKTRAYEGVSKRPWISITERYMNEIWDLVKGFVENLLRDLVDAEGARRLLDSLISPCFDQKLERATPHLTKLLAGIWKSPASYNDSY